jgi:hypothetical protein
MDMSTPPAPNPSQPSGNALMMPQPQQQMPAAPSHQETVAALRHFMAVVAELKTLANNPSLGKADLKGPIIEGVTGLVSQRMMKPGDAVIQLASVPDDPQLQRKWVADKLQQTIAAQNNVLDHHVAAHPGTLDWNQESQHAPGAEDDHMQTMDGLAGHYRPGA